MTKESQDGWAEWKNHVLIELRRYGTALDSMDARLDRLSSELAGLKAGLKIRAAILGGVAGILGSAGVGLVLKHLL